MNKWMKVTLASIVFAGISACSSEKSTSNDNKIEASAQTNKLQTKFVNIATGGASGPYNVIGTSLAEIYNKTYGVNSKTQTTGASVENLNLLKQNKVEMAFVMSDSLTEALNGTGSFKDAKIENVQQISALYPNYVQIVTSKKTGIKNIEDLKGKRIAVGAQNSGVEVNARTLLNGFGITYNDVKVDYLGYAEAADALKGGKIDAAFLTSGIPNSSLMELQQGFDLQIVGINPEKVKEIAKNQSYFLSLNIPKGTYGNDVDIPTAAIMNALVIRSDISEEDGYKLTKTFFDSLSQLANSHQAATEINLENAQSGAVIPLHPGAKRYFTELNKK
ncbi:MULTISPECIES: TAXI family TRAP transporter solute-binding subunit [Acinetobacter]|uniref:TAXI family TRAP transporter solute-binding subunit n=1 Tax=Acinetobacter faecalis TaxID=2665161 RepID=A0AB35UP95_9GAMM|nr:MULTISPECIES: TAXI family TRAP transporter solute-binding subunit [Acinetobacter]MBP7783286.1 TAXI family TRAP transporter solute-binding subunit [Acinetobacter sp.]MBP7793805.1 TAXI family TRAP transporter solute-binding subunit [Acinetobacter sp.]MBP8063608.1 TAXI family TRAP transporter solute-binding subunit [Acinetobacter sp.]MDY6459504.1 TAXI family TRAP transporter solute-binding subunit [Acinetobacter faecalis]MDY6460707.1 TAXI family TRAP transporter solute-binding subunit [Acineto